MLKTKTVDKDEIVLALCCKAGINRLVGLGAIATQSLEQEGFEVHNVWLSKSEMIHRRICMDCDFCKTGSDAKLDNKLALELAVRMWRSI